MAIPTDPETIPKPLTESYKLGFTPDQDDILYYDEASRLWLPFPLGVPTVEPWIEIGSGGSAPAFAANWANLGAPYNTCGFFKDPFGIVHLKGLPIADAASGFKVFTLPAGYRPAAQDLNIVQAGLTVTSVGRLIVEPDGDVISSTSTAGHFTTLDRVTFRAV